MAHVDILTLPGLGAVAPTPCLTVKQPWAALIIAGLKDVENRTWSTRHRGPLLIHAAKTDDAVAMALLTNEERSACDMVGFVRGAIIGTVRIDDVVTNSQSPYAQPLCYHWIISEPELISPLFVRGQLGLWYFTVETPTT